MTYSDPMTDKLIGKAEAYAIAYVRASAWTIAAQAQSLAANRAYGINNEMAAGHRNRAIDAYMAEMEAQRAMDRAAFELSKVYLTSRQEV